MKVGILGAGLIGRKRALALPKNVKLEIVCDVDFASAKKFAEEFGIQATTKTNELFDRGVDAVFIATPNGFLADLAVKSLKAGKHILVEKPGGVNSKELEKVFKVYKRSPRVVQFGYNHRYHPALLKTREILKEGTFGKILFVRARYGHGGRLGYEKEWRFKKGLSGGGELIDQGSHLIDLTNYLVGEMPKVKSTVKTFFWKTELEDTAFFILENNKNQAAFLSVSCVEWKNIFSFEVMLEKAKIQIDGLGRSYGTEKLTLYKMRPEMGPPDVEEFVFEEEDLSWQRENKVFFQRIKEKDFSDKPLKDALYVLDTIEKIYKQNEE